MGLAGARYDARQLGWIGSLNAEVAIAIAWHTHAVKTAKDLETTELVIAAGGATDISAVSPLAVNRAANVGVQPVASDPRGCWRAYAVCRPGTNALRAASARACGRANA